MADEEPTLNARPGPAELRQRYAGNGLFWTNTVSYRIGAIIAWLLEPTGVSPNLVTLASLSTNLLGAALVLALPTIDTLPSAALIFVVWQIGYGLDCADGLLARRLGRTSAFGAWLDQIVDLLGHMAIFGVLASVVSDQLGMSTLAGALFSVIVVGGNSILGVAVGLRGASMGRATVAWDRPRLGILARLLNLIDHGFVLALASILLISPSLLAIYLAVVAIVALVAVGGLGFLLSRTAAAAPVGEAPDLPGS